MSLKDEKQQNIQSELDFSSALTGESRDAGRKGAESSGAMNGTENPASTNRVIDGGSKAITILDRRHRGFGPDDPYEGLALCFLSGQ